MKQKGIPAGRQGFTPIIILVLVVIAGIGYLGYKYFKTNFQIIPTSPPTSLASTEPSINPIKSTEGWKIFNGTTYSVKYPYDWNFRYVGEPGYEFSGPLPGSLSIDNHNNLKFIEPVNVWLDKKNQEIEQKGLPAGPLTLDSINNVFIAGEKTIKIDSSVDGDRLNYNYLFGHQGITYNINIRVSERSSEPETQELVNRFNQILSTFKFTDDRNTNGQTCGGIMGKTCPEGTTCKLDGNYPDASGTCI